MPSNGPYSNEAVAQRVKLTLRALGYRSDAAYYGLVDGMNSTKWAHYQGRSRLPTEIAIDLCARHAWTGIDLDWIYRGIRDNLRGPFLQELERVEAEASQNALQSRSRRQGRP